MDALSKLLLPLGSAVLSGSACVVARYMLWMNGVLFGISCLTPVSKVGKETPLESGIDL